MQKFCQPFDRLRVKPELKIVFLGTPEFGAMILEKLIEVGYKPILVVTTPDKPVGRKQILTPPAVKILGQRYKILVEQPTEILELKSKILHSKPDLIITAAYGQIIPKEILEIPKYGCLNVHPSLLPKYRGPSPIQTAILNGDEQTGVTIMLMDEKIDHGPILAQQELEISKSKAQMSNQIQNQKSKITYLELHNHLARLGAQLLIKTIPKWIADEIQPVPQDESRATYTKIIGKEDGKIDWSKSAEEIERMMRALNPWPSSFTEIKYPYGAEPPGYRQKSKIKILESEVLPCENNKSIGKVFLTEDKKLVAQTGKDCLIIKELQLEGKNKMTAQEFLNGHPEILGSIFE